MLTHKLERDDAPDYVFTGEELAKVSSRQPGVPRWSQLTLYKTVSGLYVCHSEGCSSLLSELTRSKAAIASTHDDVIQFFGHGRLAKKLYVACGIEDVEIIPDIAPPPEFRPAAPTAAPTTAPKKRICLKILNAVLFSHSRRKPIQNEDRNSQNPPLS